MEAILTKLRESVGANSYTQYNRIYNKLKIKSIDDLRNVKEIEDKLEDKTNNTKKNYYASIVKLLRYTDEKELLEKYKKLMNDYIEKTKPTDEYNEKQKKNLMTIDEIEEIRINLIKGITNFTTKLNYDLLLDYVILSLYTLQPPRRNEFYNMKIVNTLDKIKDDENYLLWGAKKKMFIFQDYKTAKKYGKEIVPINKDLQDVISLYLKNRKHIALEGNDYFLVKYGNLEFEHSNDITRTLNRILKKNVGASMLRHIYLSEKYGKIIQEMEKDASMMAHSTEMQKEYIKK
jgi:hypothetical protein